MRTRVVHIYSSHPVNTRQKIESTGQTAHFRHQLRQREKMCAYSNAGGGVVAMAIAAMLPAAGGAVFGQHGTRRQPIGEMANQHAAETDNDSFQAQGSGTLPASFQIGDDAW